MTTTNFDIEWDKFVVIGETKRGDGTLKRGSQGEYLFPQYVMIEGNRSALRLIGITAGRYFRDAGQWEIRSVIVNGKLWIDSPDHSWIDGKQLIEVTHEEWAKDNEGYIK